MSFSILAKIPHHLRPVCYYVKTAYSEVITFDEDGRNDFLNAHKCEGRRQQCDTSVIPSLRNEEQMDKCTQLFSQLINSFSFY